MSTDQLTTLYQQVLLDHSRQPRHYGSLAEVEPVWGDNPLCGDRIGLYVAHDDQAIQDISLTGESCAICTASASMLCEAVLGQSPEEALQLFRLFGEMLTGPEDTDDQCLGELVMFKGVRRYPTRSKCALLPWFTLAACLEHRSGLVTTE